jgi:hypothetical protein
LDFATVKRLEDILNDHDSEERRDTEEIINYRKQLKGHYDFKSIYHTAALVNYAKTEKKRKAALEDASSDEGSLCSSQFSSDNEEEARPSLDWSRTDKVRGKAVQINEPLKFAESELNELFKKKKKIGLKDVKGIYKTIENSRDELQSVMTEFKGLKKDIDEFTASKAEFESFKESKADFESFKESKADFDSFKESKAEFKVFKEFRAFQASAMASAEASAEPRKKAKK